MFMLYLGIGGESDRGHDSCGTSTSPFDPLLAYQEQQMLEEQDQLGDGDADGDTPLPPVDILDSSD